MQIRKVQDGESLRPARWQDGQVVAAEPVPRAFDRDAIGDARHARHNEQRDEAKHGGRSLRVATTLKAQLREEITSALRSSDKVRLGALRMLSAAVTNREKEVLHELSDDEVREVAGKEVKKHAESIEAFEKAGRQELADKERAEREAVSGYAPTQLTEEQVDALIDEAFAETGASGPGDFGAVMGVVMGRAKGQVDGATVQRKVKERLG
ncbi:MAG: GatB/YqeY domain-containing protein [Actinobacteria bacterium]|nr:MAG: GatB/YqeY domain-containing protein [Actinomycetota bacterium]